MPLPAHTLVGPERKEHGTKTQHRHKHGGQRKSVAPKQTEPENEMKQTIGQCAGAQMDPGPSNPPQDDAAAYPNQPPSPPQRGRKEHASQGSQANDGHDI